MPTARAEPAPPADRAVRRIDGPGGAAQTPRERRPAPQVVRTLSRQAGNRAVGRLLLQREPVADARDLERQETFDVAARTIRKSELLATDKGDPRTGRKPSLQEVYWVEFTVNADGVMSASARTVSPDGRLRSPKLRLGTEFTAALKQFKAKGIDVKAFDADWSYMSDTEPSTNLKAFEEYLKKNPKASRADAARRTPSGKIALRAGFTEVTVGDTTVEPQKDIGTGKYPRVRARFSRPGTGPLPGAPTPGVKGGPTAPPATGAPPTTKTSTRVKGGVALVILGANVGLNWIIEARNGKRMQEALAKLEPGLRKEQQQHPTMGFLLIFRFTGARQTPDGPSATGRFQGVTYRRGYTRAEVEARWNQEPPLDPDQSFMTAWIDPSVAPSPLELHTPFEKVALAKFADIRKIRFQDVQFAEWGGFDEDGQSSTLDASTFRDLAEGYRFIVLRMPSEIRHYDINRRVKQKSIDIEERAVRGGHVPVVMLDGDEPAVAVWPADKTTAELFAHTRPVDDKERKLDVNTNIRLVRWLRPAQVEIVQHFKDRRPGEVTGSP
jgi:hypothetical protein